MSSHSLSARASVLHDTRTVGTETVEAGGVPADGGWLSVDACGMCGSDWNWYALRDIPTPMILGHEIVATVSSLWGRAADRDNLSVGDRIVLEEAVPCLACDLCRSGRHRMCRTSGRYGGTRMDQSPALWGGFADTVFLDAHATVHHVPPGLDPVLAALFIPISNGLSWVSRAGALQPGETVLVMGPGQHGLACVAAARHLGAGTVIVAGRHGDEARLRAARDLGADVTVNVDVESLVEVVRDLPTRDRLRTGTPPAIDVTIDTTPGATDSLAVAIELAAVSGRVIVVGAKGKPSPIDTDAVFRRELVIRGVAARESHAIDAALAWLAAEPAYFAPFGGLTVDLDNVEDALLALGGERGDERPTHAVVVPSYSPSRPPPGGP